MNIQEAIQKYFPEEFPYSTDPNLEWDILQAMENAGAEFPALYPETRTAEDLAEACDFEEQLLAAIREELCSRVWLITGCLIDRRYGKDYHSTNCWGVVCSKERAKQLMEEWKDRKCNCGLPLRELNEGRIK